ncbi:hypothetical protein [Actinomadura chokoriensis]|uniref:Uncharacterized protein n=1 Tax=Actinomadura chokoriensis TaxID=454156 RepID=A0ABV4R8V7_9ACTN
MGSALLCVSLVSGIGAIIKGGAGDPGQAAVGPTKTSKSEKSDKKPSPVAEPGDVVWNSVVPAGGGRSPEWYAAMNSRDCDAITRIGPKRAQPVYQGLGAACAAGINGDGASWGPAAQALANVKQAPDSCTDAFAYRLLRDLVIAHLRQPGRPPLVIGSKSPITC